MPRNLGDTGSKELPQWCHFTLELSFSLNNRACRQLAKLLLLWRREEQAIEWGVGPVAQTVLGSGNVASVIKRVCPRFVPVIFSVVPVFSNDL